jgi:hypothetical protein
MPTPKPQLFRGEVITSTGASKFNSLFVLIAIPILAICLGWEVAIGAISGEMILLLLAAIVCFYFIVKMNLWVFMIVVLLPFRDWSLYEIGSANVRIGDLVIVSAILWWMAKNIFSKSKSWRIPKDRLTIAVFILIILISVSSFWSYDTVAGITRAIKLIRAFTIYIFIVSAFIENKQRTFHQIMLGFVIGLAILIIAWGVSVFQVGGLASLQAITDYSSKEVPEELRATGKGVVATFGAKTVGLYVFFLLGYIPFLKRTFQKTIIIALFFAGLIVVIGSLFRSVIISVTLGLAAVAGMGLFQRNKLLQRLSLGLILLGIFILVLVLITGVGDVVLGRFDAAIDQSDDSITLRFNLLNEILSFWRRDNFSLFWGIGSGSFLAQTDFFAHSLYTQILGEQGVIGIGTLLIAFGITGKYLLDSYYFARKLRTDKNILLIITIMGAYMGFLTMAITGFDLSEFNFWLVIALVVPLRKFLQEEYIRKTSISAGQA